MTTKERQEDLQKRVDEAAAYCRAVYKFEWHAVLINKPDGSGIVPIIVYKDHKEYNDMSLKTVIKNDTLEEVTNDQLAAAADKPMDANVYEGSKKED